jgi:nitroreductase
MASHGDDCPLCQGQEEGVLKFADARRPTRPPFPAWAGAAERLRYLLSYAVRAPSRLNSQPWLFEIEGSELRVYADARRALKAVDPQGREMVLACGAAIENLSLAAARFGHRLEVEPLAGSAPGGLLARLRLGEREHPTAAGDALFEAIDKRRMGATFTSEPVPAAVLAEIAQEPREGCGLRVVPRWLARPVVELVAEADATLWASPRYRSELAAWTRRRGRPLDGGAVGRRPVSSPGGILRRLLRRGADRPRELDRRCAEQTQTLLLLSSVGDRPCDWLAAGRATQRLLLRAAAHGLVAGPLSAALAIPDTRRRLQRVLGDPLHPHFLFRIGYGPTPAATPRRPVELVLRFFGAEVAVDLALEPGQAAG